MAKYKVNISFMDTNRIRPMNGKKTLALLKEYQEGRKSAREEVAYGNIKLVLSVVNRFSKRYDNLDDLFQVGFIGLLKSIDHFDLSYRVLKVKEQSYNEFGYFPSAEDIAKKVQESKIKVIEAMDVNLPITSLEDPIYNDFDDSLLLEDTLSSLDEERKSQYQYLYEGIEKLTKIEKDIIQSRYFEGKSQIEIANRLHISQAQVSRIEKGALLFLKKYV